ncbi:hypothetical protein SL053_002740 [Flavobacterium psychrophilum]|nr:hypothetical protein [Flavobacterium psychrophilum]
MRKPIQLDEVSKANIDWLKKTYSFSGYIECINFVTAFFKNNKIDPRSKLEENFTIAVEQMESRLIKRFNQLQSRITIDIEYFNKFDNKFDSFNDIFNEKIIKNKIQNETENTLINTSNLQNNEEIRKLNDTILKQENAIKVWKEQNEILEKEKKEYHRCMEKLNRNMKVEKTLMGKKPYINLSVEETEKLFYLIP